MDQDLRDNGLILSAAKMLVAAICSAAQKSTLRDI